MGYQGPYRGFKEWDNLTGQQRAFVEEYVSNGGNAVQAYKKAGYYEHKTARAERAKSYKIRHNKHVAYHIRRILKDNQMSEEEALARTAEVASFDIGDYLVQYPACCPHCGGQLDEGGLVGFDLDKMRADGVTRVIKKIKPTRYGNEIEIYPADESRRDIMKAHGTFVQKHEREQGEFFSLMNALAKERRSVNGDSSPEPVDG